MRVLEISFSKDSTRVTTLTLVMEESHQSNPLAAVALEVICVTQSWLWRRRCHQTFYVSPLNFQASFRLAPHDSVWPVDCEKRWQVSFPSTGS